jgi:hypothetical protein
MTQHATMDPGYYFTIGELYITPGAERALRRTGQDVRYFINQHANKHWGFVSREDRKANEEALKTTGRVFSVYFTMQRGQKVDKLYVITEADRSATTVLLATEY